MVRRFEIIDANTRQLRRYNAVDFLPSVNDVIEHALRVVDDNDMVGTNI